MNDVMELLATKFEKSTLIYALLAVGSLSLAGGGFTVGQYASLPTQVEHLESGLNGLACMFVAQEEGLDTRFCEMMLPENVRDMIQQIRNSRTVPVIFTEHLNTNYVEDRP